MQNLQLRILKLHDLKPAPYNPRRPLNSRARLKLKKSLQHFGLVEPLIWNQTTGHVVGGHARLGILEELGWDDIPVSVVQISLEQEKALNVVLNNQEAQGRYDPRRLAELLTELKDLPEMDATGFDERTLKLLQLQPIEEKPEPEVARAIEVTLLVPTEIYPQIEEPLNQLIAEHRLVAHVRPTTESDE